MNPDGGRIQVATGAVVSMIRAVEWLPGRHERLVVCFAAEANVRVAFG